MSPTLQARAAPYISWRSIVGETDRSLSRTAFQAAAGGGARSASLTKIDRWPRLPPRDASRHRDVGGKGRLKAPETMNDLPEGVRLHHGFFDAEAQIAVAREIASAIAAAPQLVMRTDMGAPDFGIVDV